jgi:hypothetical protein
MRRDAYARTGCPTFPTQAAVAPALSRPTSTPRPPRSSLARRHAPGSSAGGANRVHRRRAASSSYSTSRGACARTACQAFRTRRARPRQRRHPAVIPATPSAWAGPTSHCHLSRRRSSGRRPHAASECPDLKPCPRLRAAPSSGDRGGLLIAQATALLTRGQGASSWHEARSFVR